MAILLDRRPTLASWPKRIYAWEELPEQFFPALDDWRRQGLPPGHVTYIPQVNQYAGSPEFVTAWMGREVLLQTAQKGEVHSLRFEQGEAALVNYTVQLLRCTVTIGLGGARSGGPAAFSYNKTKEDQLLPVLNLALGVPADHFPRSQHPDTPAMRDLLRKSYAMYNLSKLCYRFGEEIQDFLWLVGQNRGIRRLSRSKPELFAARMDRGAVWILWGFYGTQMFCVPWAHNPQVRLEEAKGRLFLSLSSELGPACRFLLSPGQRELAQSSLPSLTAGGAGG